MRTAVIISEGLPASAGTGSGRFLKSGPIRMERVRGRKVALPNGIRTELG